MTRDEISQLEILLSELRAGRDGIEWLEMFLERASSELSRVESVIAPMFAERPVGEKL